MIPPGLECTRELFGNDLDCQLPHHHARVFCSTVGHSRARTRYPSGFLPQHLTFSSLRGGPRRLLNGNSLTGAVLGGWAGR